MALLSYIDFETRSAVDLKKAGSYVYANDPSTDILCLVYAFDDGKPQVWCPGMPLPQGLFEFIINDGTVIGHNVGGFEVLIWNKVGFDRYGFPRIDIGQVRCTMAMAYAMGLPGSLDNASAALGIKEGKDVEGHRLMLQLSQPRDVLPDGTVVWWEDPAKLERVILYCIQDVKLEREVFKRLMALSPFEKTIWELDHRINSRGIRVDLPSVLKALALVEAEKDRCDREMRAVTNDQVATCTATAQLKRWLESQGVKCDGVAKADVVELLDLVTLPADCRRALLLRQEAAKSSTAKLESMRTRVGQDGRIRGTAQYHGAGTGRWAGRGLQLQNFPRGKLAPAEVEAVFEILGRTHGL